MFLSSAGELAETSLWSLLLPRAGPREEKVWPAGLEHSLRIQRIGSQDQYDTVTGKKEKKLKTRPN